VSNYSLDNLLDWGRVLDELEELRRLRQLNNCQEGIRRILRYRRNWRLREYALECSKDITSPTSDLIEEVCGIMGDKDSYMELRLLAADVMSRFAIHRNGGPTVKDIGIPEKMERLLEAPLPPVLRERFLAVLEAVMNSE